jgi:hypothetical protein
MKRIIFIIVAAIATIAAVQSPPPTTEWIGNVVTSSHDDFFNQIKIWGIKDVELGLRSDGVIVWRNTPKPEDDEHHIVWLTNHLNWFEGVVTNRMIVDPVYTKTNTIMEERTHKYD